MTDLIGALTANAYFLAMIGLFAARLTGRPALEHWIGLVSLVVVCPLLYLLVEARGANRPAIYFVWLVLMLLFQLVEAALDYVFDVDFRHDLRLVIPYVMLFFAATGGMIGVAAQAGRPWAVIASACWLAMAALTFIQRAKTGL